MDANTTRQLNAIESATGVRPASLEVLARLMRREGDEVIDWIDLPTFGGEAIDEANVWSWDATRALRGDCAANLEIIDRVQL
jgi:hypothetical protein